MDTSLKIRGGNRCLAPIYEEKPQHRHHLLQKIECSDETEETVSETEFEEEESSVEEQYFCNNVCDDDETHPYDECTMFEEYTIEEYTIDDGGNMTCGDDYTFVTIHEDEEEEEVKTVRFSATTMTTYIMPLSEFTSKERTNYWISAKEKEKNERRLAKTLAKLLAKETAGDFSKQEDEEGDGGFPSSTHRGLENFTIQGNTKVTKQIHLILNSVMDEQDRQWNEGSEAVENELRIAAISQDISQPDIDHAIQKAQNDEEEAIGVYIKGSFYREYRDVVFCSDDTESSGDNTLLSCRVRTARKASKKERRSSSATSSSSKEASQFWDLKTS